MKGDIIIIEKCQRDKVSILMPSLMTFLKGKDKVVITIGGVSGTNKSETAYLIQEELYARSITSMALSLDDFYKTNWRERNAIRRKKGINSVGIREIDWKDISRIVKEFKAGNKIMHSREINKYSDQLEYYKIKRADSVRVLLVEGLYSLNLGKLQLSDYNIYLDGSIEDTYAFRKKRNKENPDSTFRQGVIKREEEDVKKTKKFSSIIIPFK